VTIAPFDHVLAHAFGVRPHHIQQLCTLPARQVPAAIAKAQQQAAPAVLADTATLPENMPAGLAPDQQRQWLAFYQQALAAYAAAGGCGAPDSADAQACRRKAALAASQKLQQALAAVPGSGGLFLVDRAIGPTPRGARDHTADDAAIAALLADAQPGRAAAPVRSSDPLLDLADAHAARVARQADRAPLGVVDQQIRPVVHAVDAAHTALVETARKAEYGQAAAGDWQRVARAIRAATPDLRSGEGSSA